MSEQASCPYCGGTLHYNARLDAQVCPVEDAEYLSISASTLDVPSAPNGPDSDT